MVLARGACVGGACLTLPQCLQAMLNRLADDADVTPLYRLQREADSFSLSTPFMSASAPRIGGAGPLLRPPQLMLPEDSLASLTQAMVPAKGVVDSALAFTVQAVRYGIFYGEDGKSITVRMPASALRCAGEPA